jgi:hypothetical protein
MSRRLPTDREQWESGAFGRGARSACPAPDLLLPAVEGVLPEPGLTRVREHLATCPLCRELSTALDNAASEGPSLQERGRLDARFAGLGRRRFPSWMAAAAAVLLTAGAAAWVSLLPEFRPPVPGEPPRSAPAPSRAPAFVLALKKPSIELPAAALVLRGSTVEPYISALVAALDPFRRGQYDDAARRLAAVERQYPQKPHVPFYLGVSELLAGRPGDAIAPLQRSRSLAADGTAIHADASWYLAVALERQARRDESMLILTDLCGSGGARNDEACLALHGLLSPAAGRPPLRR